MLKDELMSIFAALGEVQGHINDAELRSWCEVAVGT